MSKIYYFFLWGRPVALWGCQRPRKPITYACGMIPERCGPSPTRTVALKDLGVPEQAVRAWMSLSSLQTSLRSCSKSKWHYFSRKISVGNFSCKIYPEIENFIFFEFIIASHQDVSALFSASETPPQPLKLHATPHPPRPLSWILRLGTL